MNLNHGVVPFALLEDILVLARGDQVPERREAVARGRDELAGILQDTVHQMFGTLEQHFACLYWG
jgi:hypothetical protein